MSCVLVLIATVGCGKKGPPQAPLIIVPAPVSDVSSSRLGNRAIVRFTLPEKNTDNSTPADLSRVDMYALSVENAAAAPDAAVVLREGTRIGSVEIGKPAAGAEPEQPVGPRTLSETLTAESLTFWKPREPRAGAQGSSGSSGSGSSGSSGSSGLASAGEPKTGETKPIPVRLYALVPVSSKGRRGPAMLATVPIVPPPPPLEPPVITYSEKAVSLVWVGVEGLSGYNVYRVGPAITDSASAPGSPLNDSPLKAPAFEDPHVEYGKERCYSVTSVELVVQRRIESVLSEPACVTPVDTFPPAPPTGLAAVAGPGTMSLIWDAVNTADLAGYVVLRGAAGGDTLQALTPEPIKETTFQDVNVTPGTRYVYAVVAVDTAKNKSAEARVEETAR
ncbi:MAG: fibronectin type III domain-containing protein [Acidobacteriota bacterium]